MSLLQNPCLLNILGKGRKHALPLVYLSWIPFYLFVNLFTLKGLPRFFAGDNQFFSLYASRINNGQQVYRDFFQFTPPGTDYIYLLAIRICGAKAWVPNIINILVGTALCWLLLSLARRLMPASWSMVACAVFLAFIYGRFLDPTHHWFSLFAGLLSVRVLIDARTPARLLAAGSLVGIAAFFTQTAGAAVLAGIAMALLYEDSFFPSVLSKQMWLLLGAGVTWLSLTMPLLYEVGWRTLWYHQVLYPYRYIQQQFINPLPLVVQAFQFRENSFQLQELVIYLLLLISTPATLLILWWRRLLKVGKSQCEMPLVLLASTGLFSMLEVIFRPNWLRLYAATPPSLIVVFAAVSALLRHRRRFRHVALIILWISVAITATRQTLYHLKIYNNVLLLPSGGMAMRTRDCEEFSMLAARTRPGELFLQVNPAHLYYPLQLQSPIYADYLMRSIVTRPEFVANAVSALQQKHVRYIVFAPRVYLAGTQLLPSVRNSDPFLSYLCAHYNRVRNFANGDELWELMK